MSELLIKLAFLRLVAKARRAKALKADSKQHLLENSNSTLLEANTRVKEHVQAAQEQAQREKLMLDFVLELRALVRATSAIKFSQNTAIHQNKDIDMIAQNNEQNNVEHASIERICCLVRSPADSARAFFATALIALHSVTNLSWPSNAILDATIDGLRSTKGHKELKIIENSEYQNQIQSEG